MTDDYELDKLFVLMVEALKTCCEYDGDYGQLVQEFDSKKVREALNEIDRLVEIKKGIV